jgi:2-amino-4-hydroxy-6-hydroxymethyldihydropteridine diphosphokinase
MTLAYLSLGSNLGDRLAYLTEAVRRLEAGHTRVLRVSSVYETAPWGKTDQPAFLNIAAVVETDMAPADLLNHIAAVEQGLGRVRHERWGPRTIDIDILLYGTSTVHTPSLDVPHPRMTERAFVLTPLLEIGPDLPYQQALEALGEQGIALYLPAGAFLQRVGGVQ